MGAGSVSAGGGSVSVSGVPRPLLARRFRCGLGRSHSGRGRFGPLRSLSPSTPGSSWLWREVSSTSSLSFPAPRCPCSWTIPLPWLTCASNGALAHWLSTLLRSGFSVGRSLFALFSLPNSSWGGTMFSRTPCPTQSDPWLGVDSEVGGLLGAPQEVPGDDRPFCHLVESPMFALFLSLQQSECSKDGRASSELGRSSGLRLSTLGPDSSRSQRPWFPYLLELVVDGPVVLPFCPDLLRQPHFHCHYLGIHRLSLHA